VKFVRQFAHFWYDFIVGDDWRLAVGVVTIVFVTYVAAHDDVNAWWLLPLGVAALLCVSVGLVPSSRRAPRQPRR
jgi:hypothetical protein